MKITLCVEQTKSKLLWGVNYSNRERMSMPSFIKRSVAKCYLNSKVCCGCSLDFCQSICGEGKKKDVRPEFQSPLAHLHCRKGMEEQKK